MKRESIVKPRHFVELAICLLLAAFVLQNITLATGDYRKVLWTSLVLTVIAVGLLAWAFFRRGTIIRVVAVLFFLATFFLFNEFLRRSPSLFDQ
ncbi:MAG: hypothetical protein ACI8UO_004235 [Verrucomicrobiales bacterium]|jgi:hypothetical protein